MSEGYHLYVISFTVGSEAGLALVSAQSDKAAFQILVNGGSRCSKGYSLIQCRDIGVTSSCSYGLLLESFVNAREAYDAIISVANNLRGVPGPSMYEEAVENGYTGTEEQWLEEHSGPRGDDGSPAGFGTITASVDSLVGNPSITVTASGPNTAKNFDFSFSGLKGETGAVGADGQSGASAYDIWISEGNEGDEQDFLESLKGEDGQDGDDGKDGVGFESVASPAPADGTAIITLSNGDTITLDLNHNHTAYPKYTLLNDEAAYEAITTKESDMLYLIKESQS